MKRYSTLIPLALAFLMACGDPSTSTDSSTPEMTEETESESSSRTTYTSVRLKTDMSLLNEEEKQVIPYLIRAAQFMDSVFWLQSYGDPETLLSGLSEADVDFARINYGPWDRLDDNAPFMEGVGSKALGAEFYPKDMTQEEFEAWDEPNKKSLYTLIRRADGGELVSVPYHIAYARQTDGAAAMLDSAASLTTDDALKNYLQLRAEALRSDDFMDSDRAWLDMKENHLDIIIGPIENYEDKLFGYKAAHEAYVLVKDMEWSARLDRYVQFLPDLQAGIPVDDVYKQDEPGRDAQLNAYDVIYYAGDCNAGSKTIAVNLPNDEELQVEKGTRRSQLKNAMKAKYDRILIPIADELITEEQRESISFEAFFGNTMFHEVAHGLGVKNTINGRGTVREALKAQHSALEEGKADILGLYMVTRLIEDGQWTEASLEEHYVTFLASIFRSVRFGASSAHGKANMLRFNYFQEKGAFTRDEKTGRYRVDMEKMAEAMNGLTAKILMLQGDGDLAGTETLMQEMGSIQETLAADLARLEEAGIPVDVVFEQGTQVLGL